MGGLIVVEDSNNYEVSFTPKDGGTGPRTVTIPDSPLDKEVDTLGFRNKLINGGFDVWQRGTSFVNPVTGDYTADRWRCLATDNATITLGNHSGSERGVGIKVDSVGVTAIASGIEQRVELPRNYSGRQMTLSFDWYANVISGYEKVIVKWTDGSQVEFPVTDLIVGGSVKKEFTFTVPTDATDWSYFRVQFLGNDGVIADSSFILFRVQLEEGSVATPFEKRPTGLELSLCQRYYQKKTIRYRFSKSETVTAFFPNFQFGVPMRSNTPSLDVSAINGMTAIAGTDVAVSANGGTADENGVDYITVDAATYGIVGTFTVEDEL